MPTLPARTWASCLMLQLLCLQAVPALAGEITAFNGKVPTIAIGGVIASGDEKVFHEFANATPNAIVVLAGPGGRVYPALVIGMEIRARGMKTLVPAGARCASACSFIWLAGSRRLLGDGAQVGFHAISDSRDGRVYTETHIVDPVLMHYLLGLGYAGDAVATIVNTPSVGIRWLDRIELNSNGFDAESYP